MKRTENYIIYKKYKKFENKRVKISGWVRTSRTNKNIAFIECNDGTYFKSIQLVLEHDKLENYNEITKLNVGSAITAEGNLILTPNSKQDFEINVVKAKIEGESTSDYPLQKKRHSLEYLREIAHLRPRANLFTAVFRVRSICAQLLHEFFQKRRFVYVHTPIITGSDCEGAGEMFKVTTLDFKNAVDKNGDVDYKNDFFAKQTSLTVSGQLNAECFALAYSNVYTFGPTFRAENSNTPRHAAEFWMLEPEIAFADLKDDMKLASDMIKYVVKGVMKECKSEIDFFEQFVEKGLKDKLNLLVNSKFAQITYTKAVKILKESKKQFEYPVEWGCDLQTEHERYLTEEVYKRPVFVTDYPKDIKAFYMRMNKDNKTVAAMDLLVPGVGELIGGSQREERYDYLVKRINEMNLDPKDYQWYLDLRKYGGVNHAGFGLGFERLVMYLTGISNIRDSIPFPRTVHNANF